MPEGFKSLKEVFNTEPGLKKIKSIVDENRVVNDFKTIFPEFNKVAKAVKVQKKVLTLKVENAAWRNELKFKENLIIEKINNFYKGEKINKIKFSAR